MCRPAAQHQSEQTPGASNKMSCMSSLHMQRVRPAYVGSDLQCCHCQVALPGHMLLCRAQKLLGCFSQIGLVQDAGFNVTYLGSTASNPTPQHALGMGWCCCGAALSSQLLRRSTRQLLGSFTLQGPGCRLHYDTV